MQTSRTDSVLAVLASLSTGIVAGDRFTADARWWWNGGLDLPLAEFAAILVRLHAQMADGIVIVPGLTMADGDSVMVEAATRSPLADGRVYDNRYVFLAHFRGERIREMREYSDSAHVLATFDLG